MIILDMPQGSFEWLEARRAKVSGTNLEEVMGTAKAQFGLIAKLIAEEGTETVKQMKITAEMERGVAEEVFARKAFEQRTGKKVTQVGITIHHQYDWLVSSPDGLIEIDGKYREEVEIKNPDSTTVIKYRLKNNIPMEELGLPNSDRHFIGIPCEYKWQCVLRFIINQDLERLHFLAYDARFVNDEDKLLIVTIERDNQELQKEIEKVMKELPKFKAKWDNWKSRVLASNF